MTTYYVSQVDGNDSYNGLYSTFQGGSNGPWLTISRADDLSGNQSDNSVLFNRGGTWREQYTIGCYGTAGHPFTISAYGSGDLPKIYGSEPVVTWTNYSGNVWSTSLGSDPNSIWIVNTNGTIVWGEDKGSAGACTAEYDWAWVSGTLYLNSGGSTAPYDPDTRYTSIERPARQYGIYSNNKSYVTVQYLDVAFCGASNEARNIHFTRGDYIIIEYCKAHHAGFLSADPQGNGIYIASTNYAIVRNNECYRCARRGIVVFTSTAYTANNVVIEHNTIRDTYHAMIDSFAQAAYIDNLEIRYNYLSLTADHKQGYASLYDGNITVHGIFPGGPGDPGGFPYMTNVKVHHNILINAMWGDSGIVIPRGVNGAEVYNNTVFGNAAGSAWGPCFDVRTDRVTNVVLKNNIGMDGVTSCLRVEQDSDVIACDYNCWYRSAGGTAVYAAVNLSPVQQYHYNDFAAYKAATGWDTNGFWEDPGFVNAGGLTTEDYKLASNSPCRDAGLYVGLTEDYWGTSIPQGSASDIGAHEYEVPAKFVHNDVLDAALNYIRNNATRIAVCSTQPTTYTELITTYKLAIKTITSTDFTDPTDGDVGGRKLGSNQHEGITVDADGNAQHIGFGDSATSKLLFVTTCTAQQLTAGNAVTIPAWEQEIGDPS